MAKKLLLADDSQTIQRVVDIVLGPEGFKVTSYGNGEDAMKAVESLMPDVILADIEMPGLSGYQLCEKVKANAGTQHIPVILLAGAFEPFDEDQMRAAGADDYLLKPFESQELISKIKELMKQKEIVEVSLVGQAAEEKPAVVEPAAAAAQNEWIEQYSFPVADEPEEKISIFEEELKESMKILETDFQTKDIPGPGVMKVEESAAPPEMSMEDISRMVKDAVGAPAEVKGYKFETVKTETQPVKEAGYAKQDPLIVDFSRNLTESLRALIEKTVRDQITAILPGILEDCLKRALSEICVPLQGIISAEIKKVVPETAERIIKQEIEKINSELAK
jgi:CheY-like chemotaxis protein